MFKSTLFLCSDSEKPKTRGAMLAMSFLSAVLLIFAPITAWACGGFFCSNSNPVDQNAEQILFAVEGTDITAHIQIQYQGSATEFSWVLPLPSLPEMTVGSDAIFTALRAATDPQFRINWKNNPDCDFAYDCECQYYYDGEFAAGSQDAANSPPEDDGDQKVQILDEGAVGPFDYQVISSTEGKALFDWLNDNGYDQPSAAEELITHYTDLDFVFLALKLQNDKSSGDIQPIVVKYKAPSLACIPLKLTSIAASPDMPIYSWVLAGARAIPMNFFHVVLNAKAYDWLNCAQPMGGVSIGDNCSLRTWSNQWSQECRDEYIDLVTAAANAANGHGFVTEFAGSTEIMKGRIYSEGMYDTESLKEVTDPVAFLQKMLSLDFPRNMLVQEIIQAHIPKPDNLPDGCQSDPEFYTWNLQECLKHMPDDWVFDPEAFVADLEERIVAPLKDAQQLFEDHPYMTRTFTTISPDEMTKDPLFSFNPDLPDVSNIHETEGQLLCAANNKTEAIAMELTLPDGSVTTIPGTVQVEWCEGVFIPDADALPPEESPVAEIQVMSESGAPTTVEEDDVEYMDRQLDQRMPDPNQSGAKKREGTAGISVVNTGTFGSTPTPGSGGASTGAARAGTSDGLCSMSSGAPKGMAGLLMLFLLLLPGFVMKRRYFSA